MGVQVKQKDASGVSRQSPQDRGGRITRHFPEHENTYKPPYNPPMHQISIYPMHNACFPRLPSVQFPFGRSESYCRMMCSWCCILFQPSSSERSAPLRKKQYFKPPIDDHTTPRALFTLLGISRRLGWRWLGNCKVDGEEGFSG